MPKRVGVELVRINNKKIRYFIEHLLIFLQTIEQDSRFNRQDVVTVINVALIARFK
jgi:hypothetical protein